MRNSGACLKWLVLVSLLWSQFVFAEHQHEHHALEAGENCEVCVQLERDEHAVCDQAPAASHADVYQYAALPAVQFVAPANAVYSARASP